MQPSIVSDWIWALELDWMKWQPISINLKSFLSGENFIPESILLQNGKSRNNIEDSVTKKHEENGAMPREEAIIEYLKLAQESDMYGITYFGKQRGFKEIWKIGFSDAVDRENNQIYIGISALSVAIYDVANKIIPIEVFTWSGLHIFGAKSSQSRTGKPIYAFNHRYSTSLLQIKDIQYRSTWSRERRGSFLYQKAQIQSSYRCSSHGK